MEREKIVIELCGGRMPEKAHDADAAFDVFTKEDIIIKDWSATRYRSVLKCSFRNTLRRLYSQEAVCPRKVYTHKYIAVTDREKKRALTLM